MNDIQKTLVEPGHGLPVWRSDRDKPEQYSSSVGGDNQLSDVWFVRLVNDQNHSTVDVNVYMAGFPDSSVTGDGFEESGIEIAIEWQEWEDPDHLNEGTFADISYESGSPYAYHPTEWEDTFNTEAKRVAQTYIDNAARDIWWDGQSPISH